MKTYWYELKQRVDKYIIIKNVESKNAIGSKRKFLGTEKECLNYLKKNKIELNKKYKEEL